MSLYGDLICFIMSGYRRLLSTQTSIQPNSICNADFDWMWQQDLSETDDCGGGCCNYDGGGLVMVVVAVVIMTVVDW